MRNKKLNRLCLIGLFLTAMLIISVVVAAGKLPEIETPNKTLLQTFYWEMAKGEYVDKYPEEINLWNLLAERAPELAELGITGVWVPPTNKAAGGKYDEGYAAYDLWDLGEFMQKGSIRTKYGTKEELMKAVDILHKNGIKVYYDAVLNHRMGADGKEQVPLASGETITTWTRFNLAGRQKYYSKADDWNWDWQAFDAVDYDAGLGQVIGPSLFEGKSWDKTSDKDYLMGNDVDYQNPEVQQELIEWGKWIINDIGFDGFRLDAIKHIDSPFINQWINAVQAGTDKDVLFIGEAWYESAMGLYFYLLSMKNENLSVFDFPLRDRFSLMRDGNLNMAALTKAGVVNKDKIADRVVTFIDNHDTGRDVVEYSTPIFRRKYQAYTYIMTRKQGIPMLYWKDYYISGMKEGLEKILKARKHFAYGPGYEVDNNDELVYSYVRAGLKELPGTGLVTMIAGGNDRTLITKRINSHQPDQKFYDFTGNVKETVETDNEGYGNFKVLNSEEKGWSIWVPLPEE